MPKTTKRARFARGLRHGMKIAKAGGGKGKPDVAGVMAALELALKDAGDTDVTPFELATALARKVDKGVDLKGLVLPTTPPISLELLDGPVVFVIALGMALWWRKRQKKAEPTDEDVEATAAKLEAMEHPDIAELPVLSEPESG